MRIKANLPYMRIHVSQSSSTFAVSMFHEIAFNFSDSSTSSMQQFKLNLAENFLISPSLFSLMLPNLNLNIKKLQLG